MEKKWLAAFFWFTFAAFLLPSIPHIASYFLAFEPQGQGTEMTFWLVACYAVAISIDGTILWLSRTVAMSSGGKAYKATIWFFVILLTSASWFFNWHYAEHHAALASINLSGAYFPVLDPIVASMFPVLAIMFTVMASHILNSKPKTVAELQAELDGLTSRSTLEKQIQEYRNSGKQGFIQRTKNKAIEVKQAVQEVRGIQKSEHLDDTKKEHDTGPIVNPHAVEEVLTSEHLEDDQTPESEQVEQSLVAMNDTPGEIAIVNTEKPQKRVSSKQSSNASTRVHSVLQSHPNATITEIATKANVSRGYASQIRKQFLSEQLQPA